MNAKQFITRITIIFSALSLAGIGIAISAQIVPETFEQTLMIAFGSAIFASGFTFFLVSISSLYHK